MDFSHFQLPHCSHAGCSCGPLQQERKCCGEREGRGSSQLQAGAVSLCCDPRLGSKACEEHSWHLTQHPPLSIQSFIRASVWYLVQQGMARAKKNFMDAKKKIKKKKKSWVLSVLEHFFSSCGFLAPRLYMC